MSQILQRGPHSLIDFERYTYVMMYGHYSRRNWRHWQLNPTRDMLAIQFSDHPSFLDNLRVAMLMEAVGVGPQRYCICFESSPDTYSKLKLVLSSLPQEKMFLYPVDVRLEGPFLHEPWLSRARVIHAHPSITEEEYQANFVHFYATFSRYCTIVYLVLYL